MDDHTDFELAMPRERILEVERAIRPHIRWTPMLQVDPSEMGIRSRTLTFKLEHMQYSGSFKVRGAFANLLFRKPPPQGVIAASGGNHGAAVACAAARLGVAATIFVPEITSFTKIQRIRDFGAKLIITGANYAEALEASVDYSQQHGQMQIHAFNQWETIAGQGTIGVEIESDASDIDTVLVAVGGGGLIGGVASWFADRAKIVAVEPQAAPTLHMAMASGMPVDAPVGGVAADSLAPRRVGSLPFALTRAHIAPQVQLVTDDDIIAAQKYLWTSFRIMAEPGGAAAFAALLCGHYQTASDERICVVICGGNTEVLR